MAISTRTEEKDNGPAGPRRLRLEHPLPPRLPEGKYRGTIVARTTARACRGPERYAQDEFRRQDFYAVYSVEIRDGEENDDARRAIQGFRARHDGAWPRLSLFCRYQAIENHADLVLPLKTSSRLVGLLQMVRGVEDDEVVDLDAAIGWGVLIEVAHKTRGSTAKVITPYIKEILDAFPSNTDAESIIPTTYASHHLASSLYSPSSSSQSRETSLCEPVSGSHSGVTPQEKTAAHPIQQEEPEQLARPEKKTEPAVPFKATVPRRRVDALFEEASRALTRRPQ